MSTSASICVMNFKDDCSVTLFTFEVHHAYARAHYSTHNHQPPPLTRTCKGPLKFRQLLSWTWTRVETCSTDHYSGEAATQGLSHHIISWGLFFLYERGQLHVHSHSDREQEDFFYNSACTPNQYLTCVHVLSTEVINHFL